MKKVSLVFAMLLGFVAASFAQTAPATRWQTQETETRMIDGANTIRMADGSVIRCTVRGGEVFNLSVQSGRDRVIFEGNEEAPAGAPPAKCPNKFDIQHCYYSTKDKMLVCFCGPVLSDKPSSDPTATKEHILLARQVGVPVH
ncbi:MAG: hypothetical protein LH609_14165 [Rudanella sp.]|nr:hypothetical protein [Rudanella sp.]